MGERREVIIDKYINDKREMFRLADVKFTSSDARYVSRLQTLS